MHQYALSFNFREPYQVLLDASTIIAASAFKMRLGKMLQGTLHGEIKPMITQCCIRHLYTKPANTDAERKQKEEWIQVAKEAERRRCGHHELEEPLSALECIESVVDPKGSGTNRHRYVVASNELEVRQAMREIAGVPLIYMNRSVMILEPIAGKTEEVREREEKGKIRAGLKARRGADPNGPSAGEKRKREDDVESVDASAQGEDAAALQPKKKKKAKGPKGPNPLSVKKAKKDKKTVARDVEDERAVLRKQAKKDPQAGEKALDADVAAVGAKTDGVTEGARKRKRKRKPKDGMDGGMRDGVPEGGEDG